MLNEAFQKLKSKLEPNPSFEEIIITRHNAVRQAIEKEIPGIDTKLIGSLQKKTRIQPKVGENFDIDILVILGQFDRWSIDGNGITPKMASNKVRRAIDNTRYEDMNPIVDEPTITFESKNGIKVELVPAYKDNIGYFSDGSPCNPVGRGYWIPNRFGGWDHADYDFDAEYITDLNKKSDNLLVPTIKMLKSIKRKFFPEMPSFYLEILSSQIIPYLVMINKSNNVSATYSNLIKDFLSVGKEYLDNPMKIDNSNSPEIFLDREISGKAKQYFIELKEYCDIIDRLPSEYNKLENWKKIIDEIPLN